jgi:D-alanyl-D-alanine carboxypeptidase/D-alanyl-D-alanine-endopeptidase (penicillin-binding protein 4)
MALLLLLLATARAGADEAALSSAVSEAIRSLGLRPDDVGIHVMALRSGRVVHGHNATQRFMAASNMKLVTAATALDALGDGYEFRTALYAGGPVENGVLRGDLILRGGGDPTLGGRYEDEDAADVFRRWARVLKAKGVARIEGDVVADDSFFDRIVRHPDWASYPVWDWYYGNVSAVSINDNCVTVVVSPGAAVGDPAAVAFEPAAAPVQALVLCETSAKRHAIWFDREVGSDVIKVGGFVRLGTGGYSHLVTVPDPPLYAAAVLRDALEQEGVTVAGRARVVAEGQSAVPAGAEPLCLRKTALPAVLRAMLTRSQNHIAEQVIKTVGAETAGRGSWEAGLGRAASMLREMGFQDGDFRLADGSGLSRRDELTPQLLCSLLCRMGRPQPGAPFADMLPAPSEEGTLRSRLTEEPYKSAVRAKTGYLNGVGALSGYARTRSGTDVAFSILVNSSKAGSMRERVDTLCRAIVDHAE